MSTGVVSDKPFSQIAHYGGSLSKREWRDYSDGLKLFLAKQQTITFEEKAKIEAEINTIQLLLACSKKVTKL